MLAYLLLLMQLVKQSKPTLIFGVLLAILVSVLVVAQFNNAPVQKETPKTENASFTPMVHKSLTILKKLHSLL